MNVKMLINDLIEIKEGIDNGDPDTTERLQFIIDELGFTNSKE